MEPNESNKSSFLNRYIEPYLFPIISAGVLFIFGLIILHLNSTFFGSKTVTISTIMILTAIWTLMLWINYGEMTLSTVVQITMAIIMMITVYMFLIFEWAGKGCSQDMHLWPMIKSVL